MFIGLNQSIQSVMALNHASIDCGLVWFPNPTLADGTFSSQMGTLSNCRLSIPSFIRVQLIHF